MAKLYEASPDSITEYHEFPGRGHSLTIDAGWRDVAEVALTWLASKNLAAETIGS